MTDPVPIPGHRTVLAIALPVMVSNISTPLIGVIDTAVVGRIPDPSYIGAVALGALVFTFVFWGFGFLRMGSTGLAAQALGANDRPELLAVLGRALLVAAAAGFVLILVQWPIREIAFFLIQGSDRVEGLARGYFDIRIWSAPMALANYALLGWFIGLGRTGVGLLLQLVLNLTNMALDALFVLGLGWDVAGVAAGTLVAETVAMVFGLGMVVRHLGGVRRLEVPEGLFRRERVLRTLRVSGDIMIRTLSLVFVFVWFMAEGARQGEVILAANAILMHFVSVSAYFLDGLAYAAETLVGQAVGAGQTLAFRTATRITTIWAAATAALNSSVLLLFGSRFVALLTVDAAARETANGFLLWAVVAPLLGVWAFQLDGVFIGATRTTDMKNAMLASTGVFLAAWWLLRPFGNHGLWAALYVHYLARIGSLAWYYPALRRSV